MKRTMGFALLSLEKLLRYANVASRHVLLSSTIKETSERTYIIFTYKVKHTGFISVPTNKDHFPRL